MQFLSNTDNSESLRDLLPGLNQKSNHQLQARKIMAFVNEYATDEDIEKYNLYGIWDKFNPLRKGKYYIGQRPSFCIDREKNIFLLKVGGGGREDPTITKFLLWMDKKYIVVDLKYGKGTSSSIHDNPYIIVWDLIKYFATPDTQLSKDEILILLKDALNAYGLLGVYRQAPNTNVEFNF